MAFNHSWPDLSAFNATGRKRTRKGSKRASKVRVTSYAPDGSRVVVEPKAKATRVKAEQVAPAPEVFVVVQETAPTLAVRFQAPAVPEERGGRPASSYAQRMAAVKAARGW